MHAVHTGKALPPQTAEIRDNLWELLLACWVSKPEDRPPMKDVVVRIAAIKV